MSILACLIGILTLMISVMMQVQQMKKEGRTEEDQALALKNRDLLRREKNLREQNSKKEEKLKREKATVSEMAKLKDEVIRLTMELKGDKAAKESEGDLQLQKQLEIMKEEIAALIAGRPPLDEQLKKLREELKKRKEAPKPQESVVVQPRGFLDGGPDAIFFVECNSTGIVLLDHPGGKKRISTDAIEKSGIYFKYLDRVKKTEDSMVLFLIRKSGSDAFRWAAGTAEAKYKVMTGKLPLPNDGDIDLSLFKK